jgi:hypothetical protein
MTIWYRIAQDEEPKEEPAPKDYPFDPIKSNLENRNVTPEEIELAKKIIKLRDFKNVSDEEIEKAINKSKTAHIVLKDIANILNSASQSIPFENLKPTLTKYANDVNGHAEQYLITILAANFSQIKEEKEDAKKALDIIETATLQNLPSQFDPLLKTIQKNLDVKGVSYFVNLIGDLIPGSSTPLGQAALLPFRIMDYKLTWLPKLQTDFSSFVKAVAEYNSAKDEESRDTAQNAILASLSGLLGVISNILIDSSSFIESLAQMTVIAPPVAIAIEALALGIRTTGVGIQVVSSTIDPISPIGYQKVIRMLQGLPADESKIQEKEYISFLDQMAFLGKILPPDTAKEVVKKSTIKEIKNDQYFPMLQTLHDRFYSYDENQWENKYGTRKSEFLEYQPLYIIMKFANDVFGKKYFWLDKPETPEYQNFGKLVTQAKNYGNVDYKEKTAPSKRSIGYQLVDSAIRNNMTNQFTASLIREMANKYTAGNIYNFLNKKNIEINNLISNEARNANFAARFNVRPGSAGLDSLKVDIMNLKKILNTWK